MFLNQAKGGQHPQTCRPPSIDLQNQLSSQIGSLLQEVFHKIFPFQVN
uniref:Uncharacterized protein n=1 Tax=Arundo donax TaxID=35708 RepID=A0A0A9DZG7_ARUDO